MISKEIQKQIIEELKTDINDFDVNSALDLLCSVLDCDIDVKELLGIKDRYTHALEVIFDPDSSHERVIESIAMLFKVEAVFKLLLYIIDIEKYQKMTKENIGFSGIITLLGLNPNNINLNQKQSNYTGKGKYIEQISIVYRLRNTEAHTCESWSRKELYTNVDAVLISLLYCVDKYKKIINERMRLINKRQIDVSSYMNSLISYFKDKMKKYIMLNGEENLKIVDRFITENISDENDNENNGRSGTIDSLREKEIPEKRMIIWGEAGTGKSTTLEYLAFTDAKKRLNDYNYKIPVLISLGLLVSPNISLKKYIVEKLDLDDLIVNELLENGELNVFLDGLNEIPNDTINQLKTMRIREIRELLDNYPKCFYIISNRPDEYVDFKGIPVFNLVKLSNEQIELFLSKNADKPNTINIINNAISNNSRLKEIVRTPLMFSRLIDIVDATGKVPSSEGAIIGAFLDTLLRREKTDKMDSNFDVRKAKYVLRSIAYNGLEDYATNSGIPEETVLSYMQKCMQTYGFNVDSFYMLDMLVQLGIIVRRDNLYLFTHQAYQDYYYAMEEMAILGI